MASGSCKFCGNTGKLAKSHIVPRSFYHLNDDSRPHMVMSFNGTRRLKQSQTGIYDENILCLDCENKFSKWDNYAYDHLIGDRFKRFILRDKNGRLLISNGRPVALYSELACPLELSRFSASVLWRAHVSKREEFNGVSLGDDEGIYLQALTGGALADFKKIVSIIIINPNKVWKGFVSLIGQWKFEKPSIAWHAFIAGGFLFLSRPAVHVESSNPFRPLFDHDHIKQIFILWNMNGSKILSTLSNSAKTSRATFGDPWKGKNNRF